jgi:hypothetical protein
MVFFGEMILVLSLFQTKRVRLVGCPGFGKDLVGRSATSDNVDG